MAYKKTQLRDFERDVSQLVPRADIQRTDWKRQTDAVKMACVVSQMWAEAPDRVFLVDGRIETSLITDALSSGSVKGFFNQRCHDKGLKCRRVIVFDTKSGGGMDEAANKLSNLHFHAVFLLDPGQGKLWLLDRLRAVFGHALTLGARQFLLGVPDRDRHHAFAGRQGTGIGGKVCYMLSHAGTTHAALKLNVEGRRSRKAPTTRRRCNAQAEGLAAGRPSNFLSGIVICDNVSKREAKKAFDDWMRAAPHEEREGAKSEPAKVTSHGAADEAKAPYMPPYGSGPGEHPTQSAIPF